MAISTGEPGSSHPDPEASPPGPYSVARLRPDQVPAAGETLFRAFQGDPGVRYMFPNPGRRAPRMRGILDASVRFGLRWGEVHAVGENPAGVAVWVPPPGKAAVTYTRLLQTGMLHAVLSCNPVELFRSFVLGLHAGLLDVDSLRRPHWYLWILGVDPDAQGQGLGSALLREMLHRDDVRRHPVLLETMTERNVRFYEKHGFHVTGHARAPLAGPEVWTLRRDPLEHPASVARP